MSTEKEQQSLRLVRTDARFKEVQDAYHHLYMWLRAGGVDVDHDRYTIFKRKDGPSIAPCCDPLQHTAMRR